MKEIWIKPYVRGYKGHCPKCGKEQISAQPEHVDQPCYKCWTEIQSTEKINQLCGMDNFVKDFGNVVGDVAFHSEDEFSFINGDIILTGASDTRYEVVCSFWEKILWVKILQDDNA